MEALNDFAKKIEDLNIKHSKLDNDDKEEIVNNVDFDKLRKSLKESKEIPFEKRPKKAIKKKTDDGDEVEIVEDKPKMKLMKVIKFLKDFADELKESDMQEPQEIAKDADALRNTLLKSSFLKISLKAWLMYLTRELKRITVTLKISELLMANQKTKIL